MNFETFEQLFGDFLAADADTSMALGMTDKLGQLSDPSLEAHHKYIENAQALLLKIESIKSNDFYQNLDLKLMALYIRQGIFKAFLSFNGKLQIEQLPAAVDGISEGILQLFVNDPRNAASRLDNILSRLLQAPEYLEKEIARMSCPVKRWRDVEVRRCSDLPELFASILAWAKAENYRGVNELKKTVSEAIIALEAYAKSLQEMPATAHFAIGEEKVVELLSLLEIDMTPIQLRDMAAAYVLETNECIEVLRGRLIIKYELPEETSAAQLHDFLNKKFRVTLKDGNIDSIIDLYKKQNIDLLAFVKRTGMFPLPENQTVEIIKTPSYLEPVIPAGACWTPIPLREGVKTSLVYLTLKHELIDEHTYLGIPLMMAHEGIPGHHLQFAHASTQPSLIRKIFNASEHAEGWTTMLEDYLLDHDLIDQTMIDEARFITKREIARLGARVGIDLYFMTGNKAYLEIGYNLPFESDDPFDNAAKLLKTATGFSNPRVQAELNWYSTERGYPLCYLTGNKMVWALKKELSAHNPKHLSELELDLQFHRIYLESGCMPVKMLREVFQHEGLLPKTFKKK